jgi:hypothetical protein
MMSKRSEAKAGTGAGPKANKRKIKKEGLKLKDLDARGGKRIRGGGKSVYPWIQT